MAETVQVGTILVDDRPLILRALELQTEAYSGTWSVLKAHTSSTLDQKVRGTGWNCFFLASEVKATVFGSLTTKSMHKALGQIFAKVQKPDFNCLEVTRITENRFLGMPYLTVCAHSRHIQQGCLLEIPRISTSKN